MTFDNRARRAAQGIRRAVEVMEMSSTKTPQRLTRFDEFRERKSRNQRIGAAVVGVGLTLVLVIVAVRVAGSDGGAEPAVTPPPTAVTPAPANRPEAFQPAFTYALPDDWMVASDNDRYFAVTQASPLGDSGIHLLSSVVASSPNCSFRPKQGVGPSSVDITTWMSNHPALNATSPQRVTIGGATGYRVDIEQVDGWDKTCQFGEVPLVTGQPAGEQSWAIAPGERMRVYVLDLARGTVTIIAEADLPTRFGAFIEEAEPIVESFDFDA
jgi:hypothetical protein